MWRCRHHHIEEGAVHSRLFRQKTGAPQPPSLLVRAEGLLGAREFECDSGSSCVRALSSPSSPTWGRAAASRVPEKEGKEEGGSLEEGSIQTA